MRLKPLLVPLVLIGLLVACGYPDPTPKNLAGTSAIHSVDDFSEGSNAKPTTYFDGLQYVDLRVGTGPAAQGGSKITVQYTGWLSDGTKFDSSRDPGRDPLETTLSAAGVIQGWVEGVAGMKVGGRRRLTIPPALGYGSQGQPQGCSPGQQPCTIPPDSTLVFDVELLSVAPQAGSSGSPSPSPS